MRGFGILGVVVALAILAAMAAGVTSMVASNNFGRISELYSTQAFYNSHASFEYALNRIKVQGDATIADRQFLSTSLGLSRLSNKINSAVSYGSGGVAAAGTFSITDPGSGPSCIYIMDPSSSGTLSTNGTSGIASSSCGININSSSSSALSMVGTGTINAYFVKIVGSYSIGNNNTVTTNSGHIQTGATAVADPLGAYNVPTYSSCNYNNTSISSNGNTTLNPGVYCGGISITGSGTTTLNPGNYIIDGGSFSAAGSAVVVANNVTLFLNKQLGSSYATISLAGGGSRTITAPTTGAYANIAIFQSRSAPSNTNSVVGSGTMNVTGVIYLPNQTLTFGGGSSATAPCTMIVVNKLSLSGTANIGCPTGSLGGLVH
jgi:hypothetical protein